MMTLSFAIFAMSRRRVALISRDVSNILENPASNAELSMLERSRRLRPWRFPRGKFHQNLLSTIDTIAERFVGDLNVSQRKAMSNQRGQVRSTFRDPLHRQRKGSFRIRMQAGGDRKILPHRRSQHDSLRAPRFRSPALNI